MHPCRLACVALAALFAVGAVGAAGLRSVDRALHVRSIPGVDGWNSPLFEVHMPPYAFEPAPLTATALLSSGGAGAAAQGELWLMQVAPPAGPTRVWGRLRGLAAGSRVTLHAHAYGDTRDGCNNTGPPFYPDSLPYGALPDWALGNALTASADGELAVDIWDHVLALAGPRGVAGRALVLHAAHDPMRSEPAPPHAPWGAMQPGLGCAIVALSPLPEQAFAPPPGAMHGPGTMHGPGPMHGPGDMKGPGPVEGSGPVDGPMTEAQKDVEDVVTRAMEKEIVVEEVPTTPAMQKEVAVEEDPTTPTVEA